MPRPITADTPSCSRNGVVDVDSMSGAAARTVKRVRRHANEEVWRMAPRLYHQ